MICVTFDVSTGGSLTNFEKTWKPGAQTFTCLDPYGLSASSSCKAFRIAASRVCSCDPSIPKGLTPYCFRRNPPASFCSNSASFKLPAPKSTAKNDFEFSIASLHLSSKNNTPTPQG